MITIDRTPAGLLLTPSGAAPVLIADAAILGPRPGDRRADAGTHAASGRAPRATPRPTRRPTGRALRRHADREEHDEHFARPHHPTPAARSPGARPPGHVARYLARAAVPSPMCRPGARCAPITPTARPS